MDPQQVLALCHEHAAAERLGDMARVLATMVPEPRYEFFPLNRTLTGRADVERFYAEEYPRFARTVLGSQLLSEWTNERAAVQEYVIDVADGTSAATYHVL